MVAVITGRRCTTEAFHGGQHATLELVIVVRVEQIVLAVVLVLQHRLHLAQALGELLAGSGAFVGTAVGVATPVQIHLGQILAALPQATVNGTLHARAIRAGLGTEDAPTGLASGRVFVQSRLQQRFTFGANLGRQGVEVVGFVQRGDRLHGGVEQADQIGKGIAEETRDAQRHVDAGAVEQTQRQDFKVVDPLATGRPHRTHAHQRHGLGDVVATGTHGRGAPHRQAELAQVIAVVLQVPFENQVG